MRRPQSLFAPAVAAVLCALPAWSLLAQAPSPGVAALYARAATTRPKPAACAARCAATWPRIPSTAGAFARRACATSRCARASFTTARSTRSPARYRATLNTDPAFGGAPGDAPALSEAEIDADVAFLETLTDADQLDAAAAVKLR